MDGINEIEKVGNAFSGEVRGFQIQRYLFTLALCHLNEHDWELPDVSRVRNSLNFEELFSEKFLRETLKHLIGNKEKISQKPLKEQVTHYEKLKRYMDQSMKCTHEEKLVTDDNIQQISAITTLIAHCVVYTSLFITELFVKNDEQFKPTGITVFNNEEDILLHFH